MSLLGLDIGTTGCKAIAFDHDGEVLAQAHRTYPLVNPQPGFWELDPDQVWAELAGCIRRVTAETSADPVTALAISAQGEAVVPVDRDRRVLAHSPVSADARAVDQGARLADVVGRDEIYRMTGQPPGAMPTLPTLMWWYEHVPALVEATWRFLTYGDFGLARLGIDPVTDRSMAARTMAFDIGENRWSSRLLNAANVDVERLPAVVPSGTTVGTVAAGVAAELGLGDGVTVVSGGFDQACSALGAGATRRGSAMYGTGTTEALAVVFSEPVPSLAQYNIAICPHVVPDTYLTISGNQTGGRLLAWYRDVLGGAEMQLAAQNGRDVFEVIIEQIPAQPTGLMVAPYFAGSGTMRNDPHATGALLGLSFATTRGAIVKGLMEGVTYEQALCLRHMERAGLEIDALRVVGGGARSGAWTQLKADITGKPVWTAKVADAPCLGAAMLAGVATGCFGSLGEAAEAMTSLTDAVMPNDATRAHYDRQVSIYEGLYETLKPIAEALSPADDA